MANNECSNHNIMLIIEHNWGKIETTLADWIENGPRERPLISPNAAYCVESGKPLPLHVIPLCYRNNGLSRFLIRLGLISDPWTANTTSNATLKH